MAQTPMDLLVDRLGKIRDNGDIDFDHVAAAMDIDTELQQKFLSIPYEEISAVKIENSKDGHGYYAGSGPETVRAGKHDNPNWLYNTGVHALALWQHLKLEQERPRIPEPGVYLVTTKASGHATTAIVTDDRRVVVPQTGLGTMADKTFVFRDSESEFVWQRVDLATGDLR